MVVFWLLFLFKVVIQSHITSSAAEAVEEKQEQERHRVWRRGETATNAMKAVQIGRLYILCPG